MWLICRPQELLLGLVLVLAVVSAAKKGKSAAPPAAKSAADSTIEDVDEPAIDEILEDDKSLVILFYDSKSRCAGCPEALREMEEIDDDLEEAHIEVVKSDDKKVMKELGIHTLPSLIYFRRRNPILYEGDFEDSETVLRWLRAHDEVATVDLDDDDFEDRTDSASPSEGALDWLVMFYDSSEDECEAYIPVLELTAHRLRGLVHVAKVDIDEDDDVAHRFGIDEDDDCPTFLLFHKGKMYRYVDTAGDSDSLYNFALHKFKEHRGHRVPDPPTLLEEIYEEVKEEIGEIVEEHSFLAAGIGGALGLGVISGTIYWAYKTFKAKKEKGE